MVFATNKLLACLLVALISAGVLTTQAADFLDTLYLKSGEEIKGEVTGTLPNGAVQFKFAQGTLPYPKNSIKKVEIGERPELKQAQTAAEAGNYQEVIKILTPVVDKFLGYKSPWIGQAAGDLANALAQTGKTFKAIELGKRITELYPDTSIGVLGTILEANTLIQTKKPDEALAKLDSIKADLPVKTSPTAGEMQLLGDYHMAMGIVMEQKNNLERALEHYLTVAAVYPTPQKRAKRAQKKADALLKANSGLMVP